MLWNIQLMEKIESWIDKWSKKKTDDKLFSLLLVAIIVLSTVSITFYQTGKSQSAKAVDYLKKEKDNCENRSAKKDLKIEELQTEIKTHLIEEKNYLLRLSDSLKTK